MVRIIIKGGVWKNTEDEILKAAISKYGKNQWARISSLLVRKTPKQCKARWYEWLDPSIKKTEWSKEEDEKLLHLAKLMPTQWRTIAPIVGRTATQCLERYQKLLDEAESRDNAGASGSGLALSGPGGEAAPSAEDVRRLRPGEIDPDPETKPARPDPIDMDEDEKEMLSEARARLANTQGKKAKRKARERSLEEARRLALLQKRRELKAAGIVMRGPKKQKGMDYNADIPFEKQPARGFYDTSEEATRSYQAPVGKTITALNGGKKARDEAMNEGKDKKRGRGEGGDSSKEKDPFKDAGKEDQIRKLREAEQISKRRKLDLPAVQVGESELEEIVKMGRAGQISRDLVAGEGVQSTEGLLGDYEALEKAKHARTPMVAPEDDAIMREARNLRNRTEAQTPLLGDANAPIHEGTGNSGALPRGGAVQTPNPLLTPAHSGRMGDPGATPMSVRGGRLGAPSMASATPRTEVGGVGQTPMRTPLRDTLGLNEEQSMMGDTPMSTMTSSRSEKYARANARRELQMGLKGLPAPKNDFELVMDEDEEKTTGQDVLEDEVNFGVPLSEEDAAERDARIEKLKEERRLKELARRSQVVQLGLPRPPNVDERTLINQLRSVPLSSDSPVNAKAQRLIDEEMVRLLKHDSIVYPIAGSKAPGGSRSDLAALPDEYVEEARNLIHVELATLLGFPGANASTVKRLTTSKLEENEGASLEAFEKVLSAQRDNLAWHPDLKIWADKNQLSAEDLIRGKQAQLEDLRSSMSEKSIQASKDEKKLNKLLGGYQARSTNLGNQLKEQVAELTQSNFDHQVFTRLFMGEQIAIPERIESLSKEAGNLNRIFDLAQNRYKEFDDRQKELEEECEELQREIDMREAEKLNDQALEQEEEEEGGSKVGGSKVNGNGNGDGDGDSDGDEVGPPAPASAE